MSEYMESDFQEGARTSIRALLAGISQEFYCSVWNYDIEWVVWDILDGKPSNVVELTEQQITLLRLLREEAGGWWAWDDEHGPMFVPIDKVKRT